MDRAQTCSAPGHVDEFMIIIHIVTSSRGRQSIMTASITTGP